MIEQIRKCRKCHLCFNQKPLMDRQKENECQIIWVGLSAKKRLSDLEIPLSPKTNTGMVIEKIESNCKDVATYKTNLVKCLPLTEEMKLRYPNRKEIDCCFENLLEELNVIAPQIVFLLGEKVYTAVEKHLSIKFEKWDGFNYCYSQHNGIYFVPIHHPSYIYTYKRKQLDDYVNSIQFLIKQLL